MFERFLRVQVVYLPITLREKGSGANKGKQVLYLGICLDPEGNYFRNLGIAW